MPVRLPLGPTPTASTLLSLAFSDGLRAVQAAEKLPPAVVLLDIGLPGLNGIQAGGWIRKVAPFGKLRCFLDVAERYAVRRRRESAYLTSRTSLPFSL